jgi:DNA modification methylase
MYDSMKEYALIPTNMLEQSEIRDIRGNIVDKIKENIEANGFYEARVLSIIPNGEKYIVADGNHRLQAILELGIEEVPCIIYDDGDVYKVAIDGNQAENTYAPMDLFDWLSIIGKLKDEGLTLKEIGKKIGQSEGMVKHYSALLKKIVNNILEYCKSHQIGRLTKEVNLLTFDFTLKWFMESGLYDLNEPYQLQTLEVFIKDKCGWSKQKLQLETAKYKKWLEFIELCESRLMDIDNLDLMIELIENNTFKTKEQLIDKIDDFNKESKNKLICGDCIQELEGLEDATIDIVISDPPYGVDYISNRSQFIDAVAKNGVANDGKEAFDLLDNVCKILIRKTKPNAHIYFCCSWKVEPLFREIIDKYFKIKNVIIWDKLNHGAGDLEGNWSDRYEMVIFATKGNRPMTKRKENIISVSKISSSKLRHPTEKPIQLITEILEASAQPNDTICDPFMGAGSTIKAVKDYGNLNYIGIELDKEIFEKAKTSIGE